MNNPFLAFLIARLMEAKMTATKITTETATIGEIILIIIIIICLVEYVSMLF